MADKAKRQSFIFSLVFHIAIILIFTLSIKFNSLLPVLENTNKHEAISAVVLGDIEKSNILPQKIKHEEIKKVEEKVEKKVEEKVIVDVKPPKKVVPPVVKKETIVLKKIDHKKEAQKKLIETIKKNNIFGKDLLADIKAETKKKLSQKKLQTTIEKTLQNETEKTLRQQLLDEEIKLKGLVTRQSQGEVNRYKALILQAISENWLVPNMVNRTLSCELMIKLAPNGSVLLVQITKSSGDELLDHSARRAVLKASPLPVPKSPENFAAFKEFVLKVKPENLLNKS